MTIKSRQSDGPSDRERTGAESILLTVREVAHLLCLGERTVWRLSSTGELPSPICIGRSKRWCRRAIEDYVIAKTQTADSIRHG